jgi:hypothetical protein
MIFAPHWKLDSLALSLTVGGSTMGVEQRGRKSKAYLSIVKTKPTTPKPRPKQPQPGREPPDEAAIQQRIVDAMPNGYFPPACAPLLRCLCAHIANHDFLATELVTIHDKDLKTLDLLTQMQIKQSKAIADQEKASTRQHSTPPRGLGTLSDVGLCQLHCTATALRCSS